MLDAAPAAANFASPNRFEAEWLTGISYATVAGAKAVVAALAARLRLEGPRCVLPTRLRTPKLPIAVNGAGDVLAALEAAGSTLFGALRWMVEAGVRELALVAGHGALVALSVQFRAGGW